jgi:hypothetical protein
MKILGTVLVFSAVMATSAMAQSWEVGGGVGGGFYTSQSITQAGASASAKLQTGLSGSAWLGSTWKNTNWGGELRYDYGMSNLQLSSGGTSVNFGAHTQQFHYDLMWHATSSESRIRPYISAGGGVKLYNGTGTQMAYQPLSNFALLTAQQDLTPLVSVGGGVKFQLSPHVQIRLDIHDYLTPFPNKVITPNVGAKVSGWLQEITPMVGISYTN